MSTNNQIYGIHPVKAALLNLDESQSHSYQESLLYIERHKSTKKFQQIVSLAKKKKLKFKLCTQVELDKLCSENHQGLLLNFSSKQDSVVEIKSESFLESLLEKKLTETSSPSNKILLLVLDGVQDPHNLGACLRTANAVGADAVIIPKDRSVGLTPVVRKVACGADQHTPIIQVTNLVRTLNFIKNYGIWLTGLAGETEQSIQHSDFLDHVAIVMGAEGKGLRRLTRENCDNLVHIPMLGQVESFNVSVATGIVLYEVMRQRISAM